MTEKERAEYKVEVAREIALYVRSVMHCNTDFLIAWKFGVPIEDICLSRGEVENAKR